MLLPSSSQNQSRADLEGTQRECADDDEYGLEVLTIRQENCGVHVLRLILLPLIGGFSVSEPHKEFRSPDPDIRYSILVTECSRHVFFETLL